MIQHPATPNPRLAQLKRRYTYTISLVRQGYSLEKAQMLAEEFDSLNQDLFGDDKFVTDNGTDPRWARRDELHGMIFKLGCI